MGTLSWIIQIVFKCNHNVPYKREADGDSMIEEAV
jgi:hypothetical protein